MSLAVSLPKPPPLRFCDECGNAFYPKRTDQIFCQSLCRETKHKRRIMGGLRLYDAAMSWRIERPGGALGEMTQIADQLATEERRIAKRRIDRTREVKAAAEKARREFAA